MNEWLVCALYWLARRASYSDAYTSRAEVRVEVEVSAAFDAGKQTSAQHFEHFQHVHRIPDFFFTPLQKIPSERTRCAICDECKLLNQTSRIG
jgi:hypothetical protein